MSKKIKIYSDGACSGNGKADAKGGWAYVVLLTENDALYRYGGEIGTTNQRMELKAAIEGLITAKEEGNLDNFTEIELYTDSAYIANCFKQKWWVNWQANGWRNSKKEPVANKELWEQIIPFFKNPNFNIVKVKGHAGDYWNEHVDKLAVRGSHECLTQVNNINLFPSDMN